MALTRITKGVIKPNENYDTHNINSTGIVTAIGLDVNGNGDISGNLSVGGVLTYEDVTSIDSVGLVTARDGIFIPDNKKLQFGNAAGSADLEIFHSSSENKTIIDNNTNDLDIASDVIRLKNSARSETLATFIGNGGVSLYYDNSIKLGTAGWGIQATGILKIVDATDSSGATNHLALGASNDLKLFHNGSNSYITNTTGTLLVQNSGNVVIDHSGDFYVRSHNGNETRIRANNNGAVELYYDNDKKFSTQSGGVALYGVTDLYGMTGNANLNLRSGGTAVYQTITFKNTAGAYVSAITSWSGGTLFFDSNSLLVFNSGGTEIAEIASTGFNPRTDSARDLGTNTKRWRNVYADTLYGDGSNLTGISAGTSLSGSTNNTVCTVTGANAIQGESNLTFDGSTLTNASGDDNKLVLTGSDSPYIRFRNSSNANRGYVQMHSNGNMYIVNQVTSEILKIGSGSGGLTFTHNGTESVVAHAGYITNDLWYKESGKSYVGNFGQFQGHTTYSDFNTEPSYWGWNYIMGNTNAPNTASQQWYRGRFSLGLGYGYGSDVGDYSMEIAVPRYNYTTSAGQMYVRTLENGSEQSWQEVGTRPRNSVIPYTNNAIDLGSSSTRWRNVYTTDLQLSNEGKSNDVDGTWGNYTIQEGESDLFLINNRSGKKYKFNLTEVS